MMLVGIRYLSLSTSTGQTRRVTAPQISSFQDNKWPAVLRVRVHMRGQRVGEVDRVHALPVQLDVFVAVVEQRDEAVGVKTTYLDRAWRPKWDV
jgi:hypothetical protein